MKHNRLWIKSGLLLVACFMLTALDGNCQIENHLILKKNGWKNKAHYLIGNEIIFSRKESSNIENGVIQGIDPEHLIIGGVMIPLNQVDEVIRIRSSFNFRAGGKTLQVAAPGFLLISAVNALIWNIRPIWSTGNLITSGSLLAAGLILPIFQVRHFPMGKKFTLRVVESDPAYNR